MDAAQKRGTLSNLEDALTAFIREAASEAVAEAVRRHLAALATAYAAQPSGMSPIAMVPREGLLDIKDILRLTTLSRAELYRRIDADSFPRPVRLASTRAAWRAGEVIDGIAALSPATQLPPAI